MINLPLFSQRDPQWASKKLGTSNVTIGTAGCLETCLAMICKYYGHDTNPDQMNQSLIKINGFAETDLYVWGSVTKVYSDVSETKMVLTPNAVTSTQFVEIDSEISAGRPVIIGIDNIPETATVERHYVVIIGKDDKGNYIIADPYYGDSASLTRYGVASEVILRYVFTFGVIPTQPVTNPNQDEQNALGVIKEAFTALPANDPLKEGNLEGFVRAIVSEHENYGTIQAKSIQLDGFISKWLQEWQLTASGSLVDIESEMSKLMPLEDAYNMLRDASEICVGQFANDSSLIEALKNEKNDKQILIDKLNALQTGKKVWSLQIGKNYLLKIVKINPQT